MTKRIPGHSSNRRIQPVTTPSSQGQARTRRARGQAEARLLNQANRSAQQVQSRRRPASADNADPTAQQSPPEITDRKTLKKAEGYLRRVGYQVKKVDGKFSPRSEKALQEFQNAVGRDATGRLDQGSWRDLQQVNQRVRKFKSSVGPGQRGARVQAVENRLRKLGYEVGTVDDVYDKQTASAVKQFRKDDATLSGKWDSIGKNGQERLQQLAKGMNHAPYRRRVKPSQQRRLDDRRMNRASGVVHRDGSKGVGQDASNRKAVETIQKHLRAAGYNPNGVDGVFGRRTKGAVEQFQKRSNLPVTGRVETRTWNKLRKATLEAKSPGSPAQEIGERNSSAVKRSERLLKRLGVKPGKVDGNYTRNTQKAVDRFRKRHKLKGVGNGVTDNTIKAMKRIVKKHETAGLGKTFKTTGYVRGVPRQIKVGKVEGKLLEVNTAKAYLKMKKAASRDGVDLKLISGFRTMAEQRYLYHCDITNSCNNGNPAAPPGYSNHQSGVAVDVNTQGTSRSHGIGKVYNWMARNAHKFGFKRIPIEHWHWEYQPGLRLYR